MANSGLGKWSVFTVSVERSKLFTKVRISVFSLLVACGLGFASALSAPALANETSITVDSGFQQREGATVTVKDSSGQQVASGTTAREGGTGRPKFKTDLAPGTYMIDASWLNPATGKTETGTMSYTVTAGKNEPNVAVAEGGYQNPSGQGTSATAGGTAAGGQARRGGLRLSAALSYQSHSAEGVSFLPLFQGGQPTGQNLINEDADTDGFAKELKLGAGLPNNLLAGARRTWVGGRYTHLWSDTSSDFDQIMAPTGQTFEIPGVGSLAPIGGFNQIDNVRTESEIEYREGGIGLGMKFDADPFSPSWGSPSWGSPSPGSDLRGSNGRPFSYISTWTELYGGVRDQTDELRFEQAGNANSIRSELDTTRIGIRAEVKYNYRLTDNVTVFGGPSVAVTRNDTDLKVMQVRQGSTTDSAEDSDVKYSFTLGGIAGMKFGLPVGRLEARMQFQNEFSSPFAHLRESTNDSTRIDYDDDFQFRGGLRYSVNTRELGMEMFSDRRLKRNIRRVATLPSGLPVYTFEYLWSAVRHVGVMAQEAMLVFPDAVREVEGFLAVDYSRIR